MNNTLSREYTKLRFCTVGLAALLTCLLYAGICAVGFGCILGIAHVVKIQGGILQGYHIYMLCIPFGGLIYTLQKDGIFDDICARLANTQKMQHQFQITYDKIIDTLQSCEQSEMSYSNKISCIKNALKIWYKMEDLSWFKEFDNTIISSTIMSILCDNTKDYEQLLMECACNRKSAHGKHDKISFKYKHAQNIPIVSLNEYLKQKYDLKIALQDSEKILDLFNKKYDVAITAKAATLESQFIQDEISYNQARKMTNNIM